MQTFGKVRAVVAILFGLLLAACSSPVGPDAGGSGESPLSSNADLASLSLAEAAISPAFDAATTSYAASVGNDIDTVSMSASVSDPAAAVVAGTGEHAVSVGDNVIDIVVEAEDGTTKTYTVTVSREAPGPSSNADLASIAVSEGTLTPAFDPAVVNYSVGVLFATSSVTVTATASHSAATVLSGTGNVALSVGDNAIDVVVEAEDASTRTYTITVTRQEAIRRTFRARTATDDTWYDVPSTLLGSSSHADVFVEDGHGITLATAQAIADEFDANIYDMIHSNFAVEEDVDGNGKVILLLLDIVDGYTGSSGYVAGYFDPTHMFSSGTQPNSNEADMLFMDVNPATPGSNQFYSTIAHEMQHLVNFSVTYLVDATIQDTWINEGLSSGAEYLYEGGQVAGRIDYYNADPMQSIRYGNNFYIWSGYWELSPDGPQDALANYSTVYLFFQWLRIHASNDTAIYSDILGSPSRDYNAVVDAVETRIDSSLDTWEAVLSSWLQANFLSGIGGTGLNAYGGELTTAPWNFSPTSGVSVPLSSGEAIAVQTGSLSWSYPGGSGDNIRYRGVNTMSATVDSTGALYSGDIIIAFNTNTTIAGEPTESAILPTVVTPSRSLLLNVAHDPGAVPESYPIGVNFQPGNGLRRDQPQRNGTSRKLGGRDSLR